AAVGRSRPAVRVLRTGMGPVRAAGSAEHAAGMPALAVAVAGLCGALDPELSPGDLVVASEIVGANRRLPCRATGRLAAALRASGIEPKVGPIAGVERAVEIVERALDRYGPPVYVRKQIVHNVHVVRELERRGAVFVESVDEVPEEKLLVFSAHGVSPAVRQEATDRNLRVIDATCPLVTKVHAESRRFAKAGYDIVLGGHAGHEEIEGTSGEATGAIRLIQRPEDVASLDLDGGRVAYLTQTTLAVDE